MEHPDGITPVYVECLPVCGGHENAVVEDCAVVHSAVAVTSTFSGQETLNWLYEHTENQSQYARGIPSDCPHLERHGYTGMDN
ncbi:MAG: hypothetical protein ACLTXL_09495 [Clostridia bacterium]